MHASSTAHRAPCALLTLWLMMMERLPDAQLGMLGLCFCFDLCLLCLVFLWYLPETG